MAGRHRRRRGEADNSDSELHIAAVWTEGR